MPSLQTHNNSGRKKLVITKVEEKRKIGDAEVFEFFAKVEGEDSTVKYGVWSKSFYDSIKDGAVLDCDVVVKVSEKKDSEGNPYHNRKITQVYVDGQSVKSQQRQWGKSPETVAMEIDSKFRDTALMQAGEHCRRYISDDQATTASVLKVADKFYAWLKGSPEKPAPESSGWHGKGTPPEGDKKLVDKESVQPAQEKAVAKPTESQEGRPEGMPATIKTGANLFAFVNKRGVSLEKFVEVVGKNPNEIKTEAQLIAAWNVLEGVK